MNRAIAVSFVCAALSFRPTAGIAADSSGKQPELDQSAEPTVTEHPELATESQKNDGDHSGRSLKWLEKALARNDLQAIVLMGSNFLTGNAVSQDSNWAVQLFATAAVAGDSDAKRFMGFAYANGTGVPQDIDRARDWLEASAEEGNAKAQVNLGELFYLSSPPDYTNAIHWISQSALQGYAPAESDLGMMYEAGKGVNEDRVEALTWLRLATDGGSKDAAGQLAALEAVMDPSQIKEAERRVRVFKPKSGKQLALDKLDAVTCPLGDAFQIPVKLFDESKFLLVDTGSFITSLDTSYKDRLGDLLLTLRSSRFNVDLYGAPEIFINETRFAPLLATIGNTQKFREVIDEPLDGVLGMNFLKRYVICFDSDKSSFKIGGLVPEEVKKYAMQVPLIETPSKDIYGIQVFINGRGPFLLFIDSGYSGSVSLDEEDWEKVYPAGTTPSIRGKAVTFDSRIEETKSARLQSLTIGTNSYTNLIAGCISGRQSSSTLGMEFLQRHTCIFDFPNHTLYLLKGRYFARSEEQDMSGLNLLSRDGTVQVYSVEDNSPAFRAGLTPGDRIISVNGQKVPSLSLKAIREALKTKPGAQVSLQAIRNGETKSFTLTLMRLI